MDTYRTSEDRKKVETRRPKGFMVGKVHVGDLGTVGRLRSNSIPLAAKHASYLTPNRCPIRPNRPDKMYNMDVKREEPRRKKKYKKLDKK